MLSPAKLEYLRCTVLPIETALLDLSLGKLFTGQLFDQVWPKFGFDAPLVPADLNRNPQLAKCCSVQDVHAIDAKWWEANGRGTEMRFDLSPDSRSWRVLLNYLSTKFAKEWR